MGKKTDIWRYVRRQIIKSRRLSTNYRRKVRGFIFSSVLFMIILVVISCCCGIFKPDLYADYEMDTRVNQEPPDVRRGTNRLYVGVMTTGKFLGTRAKAVFNTWGSSPFISKIDFFARRLRQDANSYNFSIVTLKDVDDLAYPPQKKSFRMLQYICDTQLDHYEWFLRADDDVYVKVQEFIAHVVLPSNSKMGYLGHPGHGRDWDSAAHRLLGTDTYCMGGPGVLFSKWALRKICPHLEQCRTNVLIKNEDIELGRCVKKHLGPGCKTPKEMMYRFFHVSNDKLPPLLSGNYSNFRPFKRALTLHPLKNPDDMYRLHRYYLSSRSRVKHQKIPPKLIRKQGDPVSKKDKKTDKTRDTRVSTRTHVKNKTPKKTNQSHKTKKDDGKVNPMKNKIKSTAGVEHTMRKKKSKSKNTKYQRITEQKRTMKSLKTISS